MADDIEPGDEHERDQNPFLSMPMFAELAKQLQHQGPLNWDAARQFAVLGATGGQAESNVEPAVRIALSDLALIVGPQVNDVGSFDLTFPAPQTVTRSQWATDTLEAYRPLFTELATSLGQTGDGSAPDDPMAKMMAGLNQMIAPGMLGMAVGSMVGSLSQRAFGLNDLPIPRDSRSVVLVPANIDEFTSQWELSSDEVRLWVLAHELAGYAVFSLPNVRDDLAAMVRSHVGAFQPDPNAVADQLGSLESADDPMSAIQQAFSDPTILLGAVGSPEQSALRPRLDAAVAMVVGYVDWIVDGVAVRLIGGDALTIAEAARRRRADAASQDAFVERLLGIRVDAAQVARGKTFIQDVVDRIGESEFRRLLDLPHPLPTPNELEAAGLWIERVTSGDDHS